MKSRSRLVVLLVLLVAALLRWCGINRASLWFDEAVSYLAAHLSTSQIVTNAIVDPHPPLYYLLLRGWFLVGLEGPAMGRWLSVLFNLLLLVVVWRLSLILLSTPGQRFSAIFLVAISPFHVLYSHELRMYTLLMLLSCCVVLAYLVARRRGGLWWVLMTIAAVLAMYTHLFASFVLIAIAVHALLYRNEGRLLTRTVLVGLVVAIAFLPWLIILAGEADVGMGSLRPLARGGNSGITRNPAKPLTALAFLLFGQSLTLWYSALILFLTLATMVVLALELRKEWRSGERTMLLPVLVSAIAIGGPVLVYFLRPFFLPERTMAAASPFLMILMGWGVTRRRSPLPLLVGLTAIAMLFGTARYLGGPYHKPPYREAIRFVAGQAKPGDIVLHTSDGSYLPALTYIDLPRHVLLQGDPDLRKPGTVYEAFQGEIWPLSKVLSTSERLWLVVALEHSVGWQQEQVAVVASRRTLRAKYKFDGIRVLLYGD